MRARAQRRCVMGSAALVHEVMLESLALVAELVAELRC